MVPASQPAALIVDDDGVTRTILAAELALAGYRPIEASSGSEALAILSKERCRLVLTDWAMPNGDGLDLCRRIRSNPHLSGMHVIMITAHSDKPRLITALESGADDFLPKPIEAAELLARIRAASRMMDLQDALLARNTELEIANRRFAELATTDELTGLANRRLGLARLGERWIEATEIGRPMAVALVDIDYFKKLNDTHGHAIGDRVLTELAGVLRRSCRLDDTVCRYGGEEFLFVLPETSAQAAAEFASRLRENIARHRIIEGPLSLAITASIGVAARSVIHKTESDLIRAADRALYEAKEAGRNAFRVAA